MIVLKNIIAYYDVYQRKTKTPLSLFYGRI
nr:MAG TPA: hypothetical protein [Bacteriophage sp.]